MVLLAIQLFACSRGNGYQPRDGDIIFQTSKSAQSLAIRLATHSPYSHMGIVYLREGRPFVFEAVQPVKSTPLATWIERGEGGHFAVKRLRDADSVLNGEKLANMLAIARSFSGKDYDLYFEWSDDRIYCSELVWKVFDRGAGIELGNLEEMREFDLSDPVIQAKVRERFGDRIPLDEPVISPAAIFASPRLTTVYED